VKRSPWIAGLLSLVIPGLGQIYAGKANKGAVIIFGAVVIANLNIIILPLTAVANPILPGPAGDANALWAYWIPRIVHDVASLWSVAFWVWAVIDAYAVARRLRKAAAAE
jgi:TM2 domain-containing membrane protein YozV